MSFWTHQNGGNIYNPRLIPVRPLPEAPHIHVLPLSLWHMLQPIIMICILRPVRFTFLAKTSHINMHCSTRLAAPLITQDFCFNLSLPYLHGTHFISPSDWWSSLAKVGEIATARSYCVQRGIAVTQTTYSTIITSYSSCCLIIFNIFNFEHFLAIQLGIFQSMPESR